MTKWTGSCSVFTEWTTIVMIFVLLIYMRRKVLVRLQIYVIMIKLLYLPAEPLSWDPHIKHHYAILWNYFTNMSHVFVCNGFLSYNIHETYLWAVNLNRNVVSHFASREEITILLYRQKKKQFCICFKSGKLSQRVVFTKNKNKKKWKKSHTIIRG